MSLFERAKTKRRPSSPGVLCSLRRRLRGDESGQALVEFALIVPLIVSVFLFAQWGWELVQVKLKVQEAARYASWEATAYPLHDYDTGKSDGFSSMRTAVMADTIARYSDLDSGNVVPTGTTIWSATWTPPMVFLTNGAEEMVYGGAIVNLIFGIVAQVGAFIAGLLYNSQNPFALSLITSASWKSSGSGAGKALAGLFGPTEWGFNKNGYVTARVGTYVQNNWFKITLNGKPVFNTPGLLIYEKHGVLADSWRLNKAGAKAWKAGSATSPGFGSGAMQKQMDRMYLMTKTTRKLAKSMFAAFVYTPMMVAALPSSIGAPSLSSFIKPSVVMGSNFSSSKAGYEGNKLESGMIKLNEDIGSKKYDSAPMTDPYRDTLKARGEHFMGCREAEKLGCTDTLSQDNPFGDYLVRE